MLRLKWYLLTNQAAKARGSRRLLFDRICYDPAEIAPALKNHTKQEVWIKSFNYEPDFFEQNVDGRWIFCESLSSIVDHN